MHRERTSDVDTLGVRAGSDREGQSLALLGVVGSANYDTAGEDGGGDGCGKRRSRGLREWRKHAEQHCYYRHQAEALVQLSECGVIGHGRSCP